MVETAQQTEQATAEIESTYLSFERTAKRLGYKSLDEIPNTPPARTAFRKEFWQRLIIPGETHEKMQVEYCASFYNDLQKVKNLPNKPPSLEKILSFLGVRLEDITDLDDINRLFVTGEKTKGQIERRSRSFWMVNPDWERIKRSETIFSLNEAKEITQRLWQKFDVSPENKTSIVSTVAFGLQMAADFSRQREDKLRERGPNIYNAIPAMPIIELIKRLNTLIGTEDPLQLAMEAFKESKESLLSQILDTTPDILQKALQGDKNIQKHDIEKINTRSRIVMAVLHQDRQWIKEHKEEPGGKFLAEFLKNFNGEMDKVKRNNH